MRGGAFFFFDLAVNFLAPWLLYRASRPHVSEVHAIMISASAPMVWGLAQFARSRKLDVFSVLSLGGIILSLAVLGLGGSPKVLLVRESFVGGAVGIAFLISAMIGRPLMLELLRAMVQSVPPGGTGMMARARQEVESFGDSPRFRRFMTTMTIVFGLLGVVEMSVRIALALTLPTERFLVVAPIVRYAIAGVVMAWVYFVLAPAFRREGARD